MKKIAIAIFILLLPIVAKAECTAEETSRLKNFASKISITYDYEEQEKNAIFYVTFRNVYKDLKIVDNNTGKVYHSDNEFSDITIAPISKNGSYSINILPDLSNCNNKVLVTKYYAIPYYNYYYKDELCDGNESKVACQKWSNTSNLTYQQFKELFNKNGNDIVYDPEEIPEPSLLTQLFVNYYYILFGGIIIISLIVIIILNKKDRFNFNT